MKKLMILGGFIGFSTGLTCGTIQGCSCSAILWGSRITALAGGYLLRNLNSESMNATLELPPEAATLPVTFTNLAPLTRAPRPRRDVRTGEPGSIAESELVEKHITLVKHIVSRLALTLPAHIDLQEIYSSGLVGLLNAVRHYDPEAGASFESYARVRIRGAIMDDLRRMDWVPRSIHEKARKVQIVMERFEQAHGRPATELEAASALDLTLPEYEELLAEIRPATFICLDSVQTQDEDRESTAHEFVADDSSETPDCTADRKELSRIIAERLEKLPETQRKVLALYYFEDMRLREIAEVLGVTESRICQIHSQAITNIKAYLQKRLRD
jgi:RNA polymerase sigma factor for flagellar operon FliA